MCEINEKCAKCKDKQICCKMQNDSLRIAIDALKDNQNNSNTINKTLEAIHNLLTVYSCLPGTCLLTRVQWVQSNLEIGNLKLSDNEKIYVDMIISELEAFLNG